MPTVESGIAVAPAIMVIFIVFGGLYVVNTPFYLSWVPQASSFFVKLKGIRGH